MRAIRAETVSATRVTSSQRDTMFDLMSQYDNCPTRERFEEDLDEKAEVILLLDDVCGGVKGFSTLQSVETDGEGRTIRALFSGHPVVDETYWGKGLFISFIEHLNGQRLVHWGDWTSGDAPSVEGAFVEAPGDAA